MTGTMRVSERIVLGLKAVGVGHLFGHPGGGSNADLIEAAGRHGLPFVLAHSESAAAFMACAQGEITGRPCACLATLGPGAAALLNGVANAHLDRVPLIAITDCQPENLHARMEHQTLDQQALFSPVTRLSRRVGVADLEQVLDEILGATQGGIPGPVHLDVSADVTQALVRTTEPPTVRRGDSPPTGPSPSPRMRSLLRTARRPVLVAGLGARAPGSARAIRRLAEQVGIPALVTYKAKGVVPDDHPWFAGLITMGKPERAVLDRADLIIAVGFDPVELLTRPWTYPQPVIAISSWAMEQRHYVPYEECIGDVEATVARLADDLNPSSWQAGELSGLVRWQRQSVRIEGKKGRLWPHRVVELVAEVYGGARIAVDAGAHMFPAMALWPARAPRDVLISNGLATMGFALPAAIGSALTEPGRPVLAFSGDGGLLMCVSELQTAAREGLPIRVVVFVDETLSLISIKQQARNYAPHGVRLGTLDWRALGTAFGAKASVARTESELESRLLESKDHPGPVLIAAHIDPGPYRAVMEALRG